jgi:hypothetical protein
MEWSSRLLDNTSSRPQEVRVQYVFPDCAWDERTNVRCCLFHFTRHPLMCASPCPGMLEGDRLPRREVNK